MELVPTSGFPPFSQFDDHIIILLVYFVEELMLHISEVNYTRTYNFNAK
jgi:hypothetical protein